MKILLWGREDLLSSSVELFLSAQKDWKVIVIPQEKNLSCLIKVVDEELPDVVIIQLETSPGDSRVPMKILQGHSGIRVIAVNPNNNLMEVYSLQDFWITTASDLISVIEADLGTFARQSEEKGGGARIDQKK